MEKEGVCDILHILVGDNAQSMFAFKFNLSLVSKYNVCRLIRLSWNAAQKPYQNVSQNYKSS